MEASNLSPRRSASAGSNRQAAEPKVEQGSLAPGNHPRSASRSGKHSSTSTIPSPGSGEASKITSLIINEESLANIAIAASRTAAASSKQRQRRTA